MCNHTKRLGVGELYQLRDQQVKLYIMVWRKLNPEVNDWEVFSMILINFSQFESGFGTNTALTNGLDRIMVSDMVVYDQGSE